MTPSTLTAALRTAAAVRPDGRLTAYTRHGDGGSITLAGLVDAADRFAAGVLASGAGPGDRVGLALPAGVDFFIAFAGCLRAGVAVVPLPAERAGGLAPRERERADRVTAAAGLRWTFGAGGPTVADVLAAGIGEPLPPEPEPGADAVVQFTSGSTADPRGAVLTQANLAANVAAIAAAVYMGPADAIDLWLPLSHDMGLVGALTGLCAAADVRVCPPTTFLADPFGWLLRFAANRSTISPAPHFAYRLLADEYDAERAAGLDLSAWRVAFDGAEPVMPADVERFHGVYGRHGFPAHALLPVYGLAESTLAVTFPGYGEPPLMRAGPDGRRYTSVGRGIGGAEVVLRPVPAEAAADLPAGAGEVCVRGPSLMRGYLRPSGAVDPARDADGWFPTGDAGFLGPAGELSICGRVSDLLIVGGRHLFPDEVEAAARGSSELGGLAVPACAAFQPEGPGGERVVLAVEVRRPPADVAARVRRLGGELTRAFGVSVEVVAVGPGAVPRTTSGKVRRRALAAGWGATDVRPGGL